MGSHPNDIHQDLKITQKETFMRQNEKLTDKMTLPLLDFLCCFLCTILFLFFLNVGLYPVAYQTSISSTCKASSLASLNITQKMGWNIQLVASSLSFPLSFGDCVLKKKLKSFM